MRYFLLISLLLPVVAFGQVSQKIIEVKDKNLVQTLSLAESFLVRKANGAVARIFIVSNGSGSARFPESDEVSHSILICVSDYGEHPEAHVFRIGPFIGPEILADTGSPKGNLIVIEEGIAIARKTHKITFLENKISYE